MTEKLSSKIIEAAVEEIPLKRMGQPEEVAKLATFLASDNAEYITGEVIKIDGGYICESSSCYRYGNNFTYRK